MIVTFPGELRRKPAILSGRDAWALRELARAGRSGCTPIDTPGPRWSGYVHNLRRAGFNLETVHERHGPPCPGIHARYVLHDTVVIDAARDAA